MPRGVLADLTAHHCRMYPAWKSFWLLDSLQEAGQTGVQAKEAGELLRPSV